MKKTDQKKYISKDEALARLQRFCAWQERCHQEVRSKLLHLGIYGNDLENIMADLIADNFLNEERFARSFARGKFRIKKWGRNRIRQQLKLRNISDYCIRKALSEIDDDIYLKTLREILHKKDRLLKEKDTLKRKNKLAQYGLSRGFENQLVWEVVNEITEQ
ncbi:MAG TPA: RecX family transcriptional regulator [Bacteroidetes bacterium]|nr:RecX family transcriptional regulator [Bacteroidota bacterium]